VSNNDLIIRTEVKDRDVQVRGRGCPPTRLKAIRKVLNEMTHVQDFQVKIYEFGFCPCIFVHEY
jgi:hypothetical protein